jgi:hypothetical protein
MTSAALLTTAHALNTLERAMERLSTLCLSFALITAAYAQPTITYEGNAPAPGFAFTQHYGAYVDPGQPGVGQTWDLSSLSTDSTLMINMVDPSTTPNGASFPGSTVTETGAVATMYYRAAEDGMYFVGSDAEDLVIFNSNEGLYLPFPCTYQTTWTDDLAAEFSVEGYDVTRTATITGEADGYGTSTSRAPSTATSSTWKGSRIRWPISSRNRPRSWGRPRRSSMRNGWKSSTPRCPLLPQNRK